MSPRGYLIELGDSFKTPSILMKLICPIHLNYIVKRKLCYLTQLFGENKNALFYGPEGHSGIDFQTKGTWKWVYHNILKVLNIRREIKEEDGMIPVVATHDGNLIVGHNDNYKEGIYMMLQSDTEPEYKTLYFHLTKLRRWKGDGIDWSKVQTEFVKAGTVLGWCGNSGRYTTGPHLHFELRLNNKPIDPMPYFDDYVVYKSLSTESINKYFYKGEEISKLKADELI